MESWFSESVVKCNEKSRKYSENNSTLKIQRFHAKRQELKFI